MVEPRYAAFRLYAKLLYESIEEIDETGVEAIIATGASGPQGLNFGIVPQILTAFAGISVFRWDINIRESTVPNLVQTIIRSVTRYSNPSIIEQ